MDADPLRVYAETKDPGLREQLVLSYLPLVKYLAGGALRTLSRQVEYQDVVSYGVLGLIDALDKYDPDSGVRFSTYAAYRIRGAIGDELRSQAWEPRVVRSKYRELRTVALDFEKTHDRRATNEELAALVGVPVEEVRRTWRDMRVTRLDSINRPDETNFGREVGESLPAADSPHGTVLGELADRVGDALAALPEQERVLLTWVYREGLNFKAIAGHLGVTDSRVSFLHTRALVSLQRTMSGQY